MHVYFMCLQGLAEQAREQSSNLLTSLGEHKVKLDTLAVEIKVVIKHAP